MNGANLSFDAYFVRQFVQIALGAGSVWFGGAAFGGGVKAKKVWKYHRYVSITALGSLVADSKCNQTVRLRAFLAFPVGCTSWRGMVILDG